MVFTIAVLALGAVGVLWYASTYNALIGARNATGQSWSDVEVELKRRMDLIGNLVETTKGYAQHEREVFEKVAALRGSARFGSAADANAAEGPTSQVLGRLMAVAESYPQLKADAQFQQLHTDLADTENRIAARREAYNQTVNRYANLAQSAPSNVVANLHRFEPKEFFEAPPEADAVPRVSFT